jgi:transcription initiation factor TFIID subunit 9B
MSIDFDLVPNKPPPNVQLFEEEVYEETEEEAEEDEEEDDEDEMEEMDVTGANGVATGDANGEGDDADGLFGEDDEDLAEDVSMREPSSEAPTQGVKRTLVEDDDYD